jgi:hypothetical protein
MSGGKEYKVPRNGPVDTQIKLKHISFTKDLDGEEICVKPSMKIVPKQMVFTNDNLITSSKRMTNDGQLISVKEIIISDNDIIDPDETDIKNSMKQTLNKTNSKEVINDKQKVRKLYDPNNF